MIPTVALVVAGLLPIPGAAQTNEPAAVLAPILRTERAGSGVVRVVYDLRGVSATTFAVSLEASDDGGQTYTVRPRALTGDVGEHVSPGAEKTIVWDSAKDVEDLQADRYVFRVRVSAIGPNAVVASPPPATPGGAARGSPPGGATTSGKKGGPGKGAIIGIVGGAAAAGVGVAVAKGGGGNGGNGTSSSTPTIATAAVIVVSPPSGTGIRAVTNYSFAGSAPNVTSGTFEWDFGDGVTGSGQTTAHVYGGDGTFRVTLKITSGSLQITGSATVMVGNVTGTWVHGANAEFTHTLFMVQQGTLVSGQWRHTGPGFNNLVPFHGDLSSPRTVRLTQDGECQAVVTGDADAGLTRIPTIGQFTGGNCTPMQSGALTLTFVRQ